MEIKKLTENKYTFTKEGENYQLDYGTLKKEEDTTTEFYFSNINGKNFSVVGTCGCTVITPTINKDSALATIKFSARTLGDINKTVIINNAGKTIELKLKGTVVQNG